MFWNSFPSGYVSNRSAFAVLADRGIDVLLAGSNLLHTPQLTWKRRPGVSRWSSVPLNSIAVDGAPIQFVSCIDGGSVNVYTQLVNGADAGIRLFTTTTSTAIATNLSDSPNYFVAVRNTVYATRSSESGALRHLKINGSASKTWGISRGTDAWVDPPGTPSFVIQNVEDTPGATGALRARIGFRYAWVYKDSTDGHISSISPISGKTGPFGGAGKPKCIVIKLPGTAQARADKVSLYRSDDGGDDLLFHSDVANPGAGNTVEVIDTTPDEKLNHAIIAPSETSNEPPQPGFTHIARHGDRVWAINSTDDKVYFSAHPVDGPVNGVNEECFPVKNSFQFVAPKALVSVQQGLLVICATGEVVMISGSTKFDFSPNQIYAGLPVTSPNQICKDGNVIYMYTNVRQFVRISDRVENLGNDLSDSDLAQFNPSECYVTVQRKGTLGGAFMSNGTDKILRYGLEEGTWSPIWDFSASNFVTTGAIAAIMTDIGVWDVLVAPKSGSNGFIWKHDENVFTDDGFTYEAFGVIGNLTIAEPGQLANLNNISVKATVQPTISILMGEISGTFATLTNVVDEPFKTPAVSHVSKRYDVISGGVTYQGENFQLKFAWDGGGDAGDAAELLTLNFNATPAPV